MNEKVLIFKFDASIPMQDLADTFNLSRIAVESLYGAVKAKIETRYHINQRAGTFALDISTDCGRDLAKIFTGFAQKEYGARAFRIEHDGDSPRLEARP